MTSYSVRACDTFIQMKRSRLMSDVWTTVYINNLALNRLPYFISFCPRQFIVACVCVARLRPTLLATLQGWTRRDQPTNVSVCGIENETQRTNFRLPMRDALEFRLA